MAAKTGHGRRGITTAQSGTAQAFVSGTPLALSELGEPIQGTMCNLGIFVVLTEMRKLSLIEVEELTSSHRRGPGPGSQMGFMAPKANAMAINKEVKNHAQGLGEFFS